MSDYFSLSDIMVTQGKVSSTFKMPVHKLGFLDPNADGVDILPEAKLELPLWLAKRLSNQHIVSVDIPKIYKEGYREILQADATVVDLHKIGPVFYDFAVYLMAFEHDEKDEVVKCLIQTFKDRFKRLMDASHNFVKNDVTEVVSKLDEFEKTLFQIGQQCLKDFQHWQNRDMEKIIASAQLTNRRKRKRTDY